MKKLTLLVAAIATLFSTSFFTSCSEPESNEPSIVGTWEYKETEDDWTGVITFVFNTDGSGSYTAQEIDGSTSYQRHVSFEYIYNKDTRELFMISESSDSEIFSEVCKFGVTITANKLRLTAYFLYDGEWEQEATKTFTRIK